MSVEATIKRLQAIPDRAFGEVVVAESRGRVDDDVVTALRSDWTLCNRWIDALVEKSQAAKQRLEGLEKGTPAHADTRFFLSKIDKRCRVARSTRADLERNALLGIIDEMDGLLFDLIGEDWVESLTDTAYEDYERFCS